MDSQNAAKRPRTIIVEHLDSELEDWQALEYRCIGKESSSENWSFRLTGVESLPRTAQQLQLDSPLCHISASRTEALFPSENHRQQVCLLDPKAERDLSPEDGEQFNVFLFGGILGDDPPRDRTGELRRLGFPSRRLGTEQMTTDTAARVTRMVIQGKKRLEDIPYVDRPDIELPLDSESQDHGKESVSMPFRYVKGEDGAPVIPKGMIELLAKDAEKDILDLL